MVKQQNSAKTRPVNGVAKKQPPPVYPKPSINHPKHPMHNKENIAMVESEEKSKFGFFFYAVYISIFTEEEKKVRKISWEA